MSPEEGPEKAKIPEESGAPILVSLFSPTDLKNNPDLALLARITSISPKAAELFQASLSEVRRERREREEHDRKTLEKNKHRQYCLTLIGLAVFTLVVVLCISGCIYAISRNASLGTAALIAFMVLVAYAVFGRSMPRTFSLHIPGVKIELGYDTREEQARKRAKKKDSTTEATDEVNADLEAP